MRIVEEVQVESNVKIIIRERGKIIARRESHNIVTLPGRTYLRNRLGAASYPAIPTVAGTGSNPFAEYPGDGSWSIDDALDPHVLRYCAFGSGGLLNGGAYTEHQNVGGLESPLPVAATAVPGYTHRYVTQALPQPDASDPYIFPSATELCLRFVVQKAELSLTGAVEVSEILALTSLANPYRPPSVDEYSGLSVPGGIAYNILEPFPKGIDHIFEVLWYWRH